MRPSLPDARSLGGKLAFVASDIGKHCSDQHLVDARDFILLRFNHIIGRAAGESLAGFCKVSVKFQIQFLFKLTLRIIVSILMKLFVINFKCFLTFYEFI